MFSLLILYILLSMSPNLFEVVIFEIIILELDPNIVEM